MKSNLQKLNAEKCHLLTMGTSRKLQSLSRPLEVSMDGVLLKSTYCETLLGCKIRTDLKWHDQVTSLSRRLIARLNALNQIRYCCPYPLKKSIAEAIFNSLLVYCLPVYGGLDKNEIQDLQKLQNKAARVVCQASIYARRTQLFGKLGWLTVNQMISYYTLLSIQKIRVKREPEYLARHLTLDSRNDRIMVPNQILSITSRSFCYRGATEWNRLPRQLRLQTCSRRFKIDAKSWTLANVPMFLD